jgi:hypothetical protein
MMEKRDISKVAIPVITIIASVIMAAVSILHLYFRVIL